MKTAIVILLILYYGNNKVHSQSLRYSATLPYAVLSAYIDHFDFTVLSLPKYDAILGLAWLESLNPTIDWITQSITLIHDGRKHMFTTNTEPTTTKKSPALNTLIMTQRTLSHCIKRNLLHSIILADISTMSTLHLIRTSTPLTPTRLTLTLNHKHFDKLYSLSIKISFHLNYHQAYHLAEMSTIRLNYYQAQDLQFVRHML